MKRLKITLTVLLMLLVSTFAYSFDYIKVMGYEPFAYGNVTVTTAAVTQINPYYRTGENQAGAIFITVEGNDIRYRIDGGDPTNGIVGHLIDASIRQNLWLDNATSIENLRMIAIGGNAYLKITYYRR